jgi:hypothetical protein
VSRGTWYFVRYVTKYLGDRQDASRIPHQESPLLGAFDCGYGRNLALATRGANRKAFVVFSSLALFYRRRILFGKSNPEVLSCVDVMSTPYLSSTNGILPA